MKVFKHIYADFVENWKVGLLSIEDGDLEQVWLSGDSTETYRIESLPFFSYDYSYLDEVEAEYRMIGEEEILFVNNLVKASGYTTLRIRILNEEIIEYIYYPV
jgi:hypothetical protein